MRLGPHTQTTLREDTLQSFKITLRWHILQEIGRRFIEDTNRQSVSVKWLEATIRSTPQCTGTRKRQRTEL